MNDDAFINIQSVFGNRSKGFNTGADSKTHVEIQTSRRLWDSELSSLYNGSKLAQKIVDLLPESSLSIKPVWQLDESAGASSSDILQFFNDLPTLDGCSFWETLENACKMARLYGDSYIVLGVSDGLDAENPVNIDNISEVSWVANRYLIPIDTQKPFVEYYQLTNSSDDQGIESNMPGNARIHASRVIHLIGTKIHHRVPTNKSQNYSILQSIYTELANYEQTMSACVSMVLEHTMFIYKMKDFHKLAVQSQSSNLFKRISLLSQGLSVLKTMVLDAEYEDAVFINRTYSGLDDVLEIVLNQLAAVSGLPKTKLIGTTNSTQFSEAGMSDRYEWAACVAEYQSQHLLSPISLLTKYYLASTGYRGSFTVNFPSIIQLTPLEEVQLKNQVADMAIKYVNAGIISPMEVRNSILAGTKYSTELTLDDAEFQKWKQEKQERHESIQKQREAQSQSNEARNNPQTIESSRESPST